MTKQHERHLGSAHSLCLLETLRCTASLVVTTTCCGSRTSLDSADCMKKQVKSCFCFYFIFLPAARRDETLRKHRSKWQCVACVWWRTLRIWDCHKADWIAISGTHALHEFS